MSKLVALFDVDNTLYDGFSLYGLIKQQIKDEIVTQATLDDCKAALEEYATGRSSYELSVEKVLSIHAASLAGAAVDTVYESAVKFYSRSNDFFAYDEPVIQFLKPTHGVVLVTAEPQFAARAVAERLGAQHWHSTEYATDNGVFTGKVALSLADRGAKRDVIQQTMQKYGWEGSLAFGDSAGDIEMLRSVEHAICIAPSPELETEAMSAGWNILQPSEVEAFVKSILY